MVKTLLILDEENTVVQGKEINFSKRKSGLSSYDELTSILSTRTKKSVCKEQTSRDVKKDLLGVQRSTSVTNK